MILGRQGKLASTATLPALDRIDAYSQPKAQVMSS